MEGLWTMTANVIQTIDQEHRPSRAEAEQAVRTLLRWAGDDPAREGLIGTPGRVARAFEEWFAGYESDPENYLERTFEEVHDYDEMVVLRDIRFDPIASTIWRRSSAAAYRLSAERAVVGI